MSKWERRLIGAVGWVAMFGALTLLMDRLGIFLFFMILAIVCFVKLGRAGSEK